MPGLNVSRLKLSNTRLAYNTTTIIPVQRVRIKICGVCDRETAVAAAQAGADAIGLVFVPQSPRCVTVNQAKEIISALPAFVEPVGLFVDASVEQIQEVATETGLRTVQLHGSETPDEAAQLTPLRVIKALGFDPERFTTTLESWLAASDSLTGLLWDAPTPSNTVVQPDADTTNPSGGTGRCLDWGLLANAINSSKTPPVPVILAGGLTPSNVGQAINTVQPYGVDVSSGVESSRGVKSLDLIRDFCQAVGVATR